MSVSDIESFAGVHFRDLESSPNGYGFPYVVAQLGEVGIGLLIPCKDAYG